MARTRTVITPAVTSDFARESKLVYWKQILPQKVVHYVDKRGKAAVANFDETYLSKCVESFKAKALDQTPFLLADADNRHTMDPERMRAEATDMRLARPGEAPGLYAKIVFGSRRAAKAILENPRLGVSARIREEEDGPKIVHVLGTLDPQVTGMAPWIPATADLSRESSATERVLDLSRSAYDSSEDDNMAKNAALKALEAGTLEGATITDADIDALDETQLDAFLEKFAPEFDVSAIDENDENDDNKTDPAEPNAQLVGAGADLSKRTKDIELANAAAQAAGARANEALRRMAQAEWDAYRAECATAGVPAHLLDLAEPVLNRPDDMVIDLSNTDDEDVNVSDVMRAFIEASKGYVDLANEAGHGRAAAGDGPDPDQAMLDAWDKQFSA